MIPNITAGETISYTQTFSGYDPANDTLVFDCVTTSAKVSITATDNGNGHFLIAAAYSVTDAWKPDFYNYQAHITTAAGVRKYVEQGSFEVKPRFADMSSGFNNNTHVKKTLDALEATIEGKASQDQLSYSIAGRSLSRLSPSELLSWREKYKAEYARELSAARIAAGLGNPNKIRVRM